MHTRIFTDLIKWSHSNFSELPWRQVRTLYTTLVSEIMLQQTTVSCVLNHYAPFLKHFPSLRELAIAGEDEIRMRWHGLGYYRRAHNLHRAACFIMKHHEGHIPDQYGELIKIPGIGDYTANALLSIGANRPALAIDANIERIMARFYGIDEYKGRPLHLQIQKMFNEGHILPFIGSLGPRMINEALMDLGRVICKARQWDCLICPLREGCMALKKGEVGKYPRDKKAIGQSVHKKYELCLLRVVSIRDGKVLVYRKSEDEWLSRQWEVPTFVLSCDDPRMKQYPFLEGGNLEDGKDKEKNEFLRLPSFATTITSYNITNHILVCRPESINQWTDQLGREIEWVDLPMKNQIHNFSTATIKLLNKLSRPFYNQAE